MGLFNLLWNSEPARPSPPADRKYLAAFTAAGLLTRFLESRRVTNWVPQFEAVERALANGEAAEAIRLFDSIPLAHMGGFLDVVICRQNGHRTSEPALDNGILLALHENLMNKIGTLRRT
jgi:hypothetical protein